MPSMNQEVGLHHNTIVLALTLNFPASKLRNKFLFFKSPVLWYPVNSSPNRLTLPYFFFFFKKKQSRFLTIIGKIFWNVGPTDKWAFWLSHSISEMRLKQILSQQRCRRFIKYLSNAWVYSSEKKRWNADSQGPYILVVTRVSSGCSQPGSGTYRQPLLDFFPEVTSACCRHL